jgi:hypothetical protein
MALDIDTIIRSQVDDALRTILGGREFKDLIKQRVAAAVQDILDGIAQEEINKLKGSDDLELSLRFPKDSINHSAIDWTGGELSGNLIRGGLIRQFNSSGIQDRASDVQLTLTDAAVIVEDHLVAQKISAEVAAVQNLSITGIMEFGEQILDRGSLAAFVREHSDQQFNSRVSQGLDLANQPLTSDGALLLDRDALGPSIQDSKLRRLGNLEELTVMGTAQLTETVMINKGRVGINTDSATGALEIWDDDSQVVFSKDGRRSMFVGSSRDSDLRLGTKLRPQIELRHEGSVVINDPLTLQGMKISVAKGVPEHAGAPWEIVINGDAKSGQPWAYACINGHWTAVGMMP